MNKIDLTEDTIIEIGKSISLSKYRAYFQEKTGDDLSGFAFQSWLNTQAGKTLKEALLAYGQARKPKCMEELLLENRFSMISDSDKDFIIQFDKEIRCLGYDFGGHIGDGYCWGKYMIIYAKTGIKAKKVAARIFIRMDCIIVRLFLNNIDKHRSYIENTPAHIKEVFTNDHGNCTCEPKKEHCRMRKSYVINDQLIEKCGGTVFEFWNPSVEKLPDYMNLLKEFYPIKSKPN
ncbi:MAG: hypothetical protein HFE78_03810 [Clostridiales bacterium]|nr:hypothetical protein [Clostridiales bacterium]